MNPVTLNRPSVARKERQMKKEKVPTKIRKDIGDNICTRFFLANDQQFFDYVHEFLNDNAKKSTIISDTRGYLEEKFPAFSKSLPEIEKSIVDAYVQPMLAIGFVLGQMFDINDPGAQEEIDYLSDWMKQKDWFFLYGRDRKARKDASGVKEAVG